jgi:uncharacterized protein (DUF4415 family)
MEETIQNASQSGIEIYVAPDNSIQLQVKLDQDTVWLTANQMAQLFGRDVKTIRKHINNALREELDKSLVVAKFASTKKYGRREGYMQEVELDSNSVSSILEHTAADGKVYSMHINNALRELQYYTYVRKSIYTGMDHGTEAE